MARFTGKMLRELRLRAGLSQAELGAKIGVSQALVSSWEGHRKSPKVAYVPKLIKILGTGGSVGAAEESSPIAAWLKKARVSKNYSVPELASESGLTPAAVYRIESGVTRNLRPSTRAKLEKVLGGIPEETVDEAVQDAAVQGLGSMEDFDPHIDAERPAHAGIYVLYDVSERPIYVGEGGNVRKRIKDHEEKFWFKRPIVESASWIPIADSKLRRQVETVLIKFLKSNAVINKQNVERDP